MEQKQQHGNKACPDQDSVAEYSLSFSGLLCLQQEPISADKSGHSASRPEPEFRFGSANRQAIKPVRYDNLAVLLPRCESRGPERSGDCERAKSDQKKTKTKTKTMTKKKSVFKSIFEPCRVCHAVEPSAIKEQNPPAGRNQSSH